MSATSSQPSSSSSFASRSSAALRETMQRLKALAVRLIALARAAPSLAALVGMAALGLAISIYLTVVHYARVPLYCNTGGIVNCQAVTSSVYSVVPGTAIPITIPGMLWFVVSGALAVVALICLARAQPEPARLRLAHVIWGGLGLVFVLYLVYVELVRLRQICEWCTAVHLLTLGTFLVALYRLQQVQQVQQVQQAPSAPEVAPAATAPSPPQGTSRAAAKPTSQGRAATSRDARPATKRQATKRQSGQRKPPGKARR
jgi:uncharacterized membrane protein